MQLSSKGFTFAEILIVVAIMGIVTSVAIKNMGKSDDRANYEESLSELQELSKAIIGDANARSNGERTSFGFIGDIGGLPSTLDELVSRGLLSASKLDTSKQLAYGWKGPYIESPFSSGSSDFKTDGWGNAYIYATVEYVLSPGDTVVAKISSLGADGAVGGTGYDSDIFIEIKKDQVQANVTGSVIELSGNPVLAATVRVYEPDGFGALTSKSAFTDAFGSYTIQNVSQGVRAITVQLSSGDESEGYRATLGRSLVTARTISDIGSIIQVGIAIASGPGDSNFSFDIQGKIGEDVTIVDFKAVYTPFDGTTGPRYEQKNAGAATVWTAAATLAGSGDQLSDLNTYTSWALNDNATKTIQLNIFQDNTSASVSVIGSEFTTTFYTSGGEAFVVGPFTVGGVPIFALVGDATGRKGLVFFDVINNTGGNHNLIDMKLVYTPYDAFTTGPEFDEAKIGGSTVWTEGGGGTVGSGVQLSTVNAFTNTFWADGLTKEIRFDGFINLSTGKKIDVSGSVFTVTLYMLSGAEYEIGPFVAQ